MGEYLRLLEHEIHIAGLLFMGIIYTIRILWLFRSKPETERGLPRRGPSYAVAFSLSTVARPWTIQKYRRTKMFYAEFVIFHIGAAIAIGITFIIPYWPGLLGMGVVVRLIQIILLAAFFVGASRLYRRISDKSLRMISSWDDYFALVAINVFFVISAAAISKNGNGFSRTALTYFLMVTFFHLYVPFSKIFHYMYYPFVRFYLGKTMAHRGIHMGIRRQ